MSAAWRRFSREEDEEKEEGSGRGTGRGRIEHVVRGSAERYTYAKVGGCLAERHTACALRTLSPSLVYCLAWSSRRSLFLSVSPVGVGEASIIRCAKHWGCPINRWGGERMEQGSAPTITSLITYETVEKASLVALPLSLPPTPSSFA